jgi:hypothetical protein
MPLVAGNIRYHWSYLKPIIPPPPSCLIHMVPIQPANTIQKGVALQAPPYTLMSYDTNTYLS